MKIVSVKEGTTEWDYMWNWLASQPQNSLYEKPSVVENEGEVWEYMGSYRQNYQLNHEFRHRNHPRMKHIIWTVKASDTFKPKMLEK